MAGFARHGRRHVPFTGKDPMLNKFSAEVTINVAASSTALVPAGVYLIATGTNTIEFSNGAATPVWSGIGTGGYVVSDGTNVQLNNATTVAVVTTLLPIISE